MAYTKLFHSFKDMIDYIEESENYEEIRKDIAESILCGSKLKTTKSRVKKGFIQKYDVFFPLIQRSQMSEALWAHYHFKLSEKNIFRKYQINKGDWDKLKIFISETFTDDDDFNKILSRIHHGSFEESNIHYEVIFDEKAIDDLLISAVEGYLSPKNKNDEHYEIFGVCLGTITEVKDIRSKTESVKRIIYVSKCPPQISARATSDECMPQDKSYDALEKVRKYLFPQFSIVGEFHSHPYEDLATLADVRGWENSDQDAKRWALVKNSGNYGDLHFALIVTVTQLGRKLKKGILINTANHLCFNMEDLRIHLFVKRILSSGKLSDTNFKIRFSKMIL